MILAPFLLVLLFAVYALSGAGKKAACDGFTFDPDAWRTASTASRLGERSARWRIAEKVADCGTVDHDSRQAVLLRLGDPNAERAGTLRWQVGDGGYLTVRLRDGRVSSVKGPT
jgi:hypothetical protein